MESVKLTAKDGYKLSLNVYETVSPRGCIQLIHGMEEHKERYDDFALKLRQMGYTVVTSDMRGHGAGAPELGFFQKKDGYQYLLSDQMQITEYIKKRFRVERVSLFCHSMGTIIARNLMQTQSQQYEKVVLSGYPNYPGEKKVKFGLCLTSLLTKVRGARYHSKLVQDLSVGVFNKSIEGPKTEVDWICKDEDVVQNYLKDPYCGHGFSVSAFHDLYTLVTNMADPANYKDVNQELPILMIRGKEDPSTGFDEGANESMETLKKAGFSNIRTITYEDMRHEILNEKGHEKVYADVIAFYRGKSVAGTSEQ